MRERRPKGSGSIYFRERDGMWIGAMPLPAGADGRRRRKVYSARSREALVAKMVAAGYIIAPDAPDAPPTRADRMATARAIGSHTHAEWAALCRRSPRECRYCGVELSSWNDAKDHKVPVARGGSDAIENLERICWQCNLAKGDKTPDEYTYTGPWPRPFRVHPFREHDYLVLLERRGAAR